MSNPEEYDYNKFLSDSSDDCPKYDEYIKNISKSRADIKEGLIRQSMNLPLETGCTGIVFKQADDDMSYQEAYSQDEVRTALENVLSLADASSIKQPSDSKDIQLVKDYFFHSGQAVFNNSQIAQDNRD